MERAIQTQIMLSVLAVLGVCLAVILMQQILNWSYRRTNHRELRRQIMERLGNEIEPCVGGAAVFDRMLSRIVDYCGCIPLNEADELHLTQCQTCSAALRAGGQVLREQRINPETVGWVELTYRYLGQIGSEVTLTERVASNCDLYDSFITYASYFHDPMENMVLAHVTNCSSCSAYYEAAQLCLHSAVLDDPLAEVAIIGKPSGARESA